MVMIKCIVENVKKTWTDSIKRLANNPKAQQTVNLYKDLVHALNEMTPSQAKAFVEYMDYRFSQGDFTQRYVVDDFVKDFSKALSKGYQVKDITTDFEQFLAKRSNMKEYYDNILGVDGSEVMALWDVMIGEL